MKVKVIGSEKEGNVIRGKGQVGQEVVIRLGGKVERGVVIRTKRYTKTQVRYSGVTVVLNGSTTRVKGPIGKGLPDTITALSSSQL